MAPVIREKALHILVTVEEHEMLRRVADAAGLTAADYVRQHIRRAYADAFPEQPVKPAKARKRGAR